MYSRPPAEMQRKASHDYVQERPRSSWESPYQQQPPRPYHHQPPPYHSAAMADSMDPESSDSDVSVGGGDEYRFAGPLTAPIPLPPPASRHALESADAVQGRLDELQRVEDHNVKKYGLLNAKRARKDEKLQRRRDAQDRKWNAILDARARRKARIDARRKREDAAFDQFFVHELDAEETDLRRRLKRLKRGLPAEESNLGGRSISSSSMSPSGPPLSNIPPPPKRHQVGPPGQPDAINPAQSRPSPQSNMAMPANSLPPPTHPPPPQYSFARDYSSLYPRPYYQPPYPSHPPSHESPVATSGPGHVPYSNTDRSPFGPPARPASPSSRPMPNSLPSNQSPMAPAGTQNPPRQVYDTRPPPTPTSSGFASVNVPPPPPSGFQSINSRNHATPPTASAQLPKPSGDVDGNRTPSQPMNNPADSHRFHPYSSAPTSAAGTPNTAASTKRTPSTTHPYQMSEAFANRHHHCERVDGLNRGIWTSYGNGGTADHPTGPAVEMYLRCNHDGCMRIDWRTVHGLQCHIVKNHEQPKGTIGSLEKALEKYGVPIKEVEDYEQEHGKGTGGTMADPKNLKMKLKTKIQDFTRKGTPGPYGVDPDARPAGYRPSPSVTDSPGQSDSLKKSPQTGMSNGFFNSIPVNEPERQPAPHTASASPVNGFTAVRANWGMALAPLPAPAMVEPEPKSLQGDFSTPVLSSNEQAQSPQVGHVNGGTFTNPPSTVTIAPLRSEMPTTMGNAPFAAINQQAFPPAAAADHERSMTRDATTEPQHDDARPNGKAPTVQESTDTKPKDEDVEMTGVPAKDHERKPEIDTHKVEKDPESAKQAVVEKTANPEVNIDEQSDTIEVDNNPAKDTVGHVTRRSNFQSPTITTRSLATTPASAKRPSRRSSVARKSVDVDGESGKATATANSEDGDREEKDGKDEANEKLGPRRSLNGRPLRRTTRY